jgi:hypothetical protein
LAAYQRLRLLIGDPESEYRDINRAILFGTAMCEQAKWESPLFLQMLAVAHAKAGNFADAEQLQQRVVELTRDKRIDRIQVYLWWASTANLSVEISPVFAAETLNAIRDRKTAGGDSNKSPPILLPEIRLPADGK